jgi:hypothetical protein
MSIKCAAVVAERQQPYISTHATKMSSHFSLASLLAQQHRETYDVARLLGKTPNPR